MSVLGFVARLSGAKGANEAADACVEEGNGQYVLPLVEARVGAEQFLETLSTGLREEVWGGD